LKLSDIELTKKLDISLEELNNWVKKNLIKSVSSSKNLFSEETLQDGEAIKKLLIMGYSVDEILKIKKEIGLPLNEIKNSPNKSVRSLTIGELADLAGVNTRTIKFWEEKGLISPFQRTDGGFRLYREQDIELIRFIKDLQTFNYTLSEIGNIIKLVSSKLGQKDIDLVGIGSEELEKINSGLEYLIERMKETRKATYRVESIFNKRLKLVVRIIKIKRRNI